MRLAWAISNFTVFACMAGTAIISLISMRDYSERIGHVLGANSTIKVASLVVFVLLGFPVAVSIRCCCFNISSFNEVNKVNGSMISFLSRGRSP